MLIKNKETEIGAIPFDWEYMQLDTLTSKITDGAHNSPKTYEGGKPIATVENMKKHKIDVSSCRRISEQDFNDLKRNSCAPEKGDVLLSKDGTIGKTLVYNQTDNIVLLSSIAIIRTINDLLNPFYLKHFFESSFFYFNLEKFRSGSAIKRIVLKDIKRVSIPIPPIQEQQKIAAILTTVDNNISTTEAIIEQTEKVKKGLMQQLLTKGMGHTKFKQTEVGEIPEAWEVMSLNSMIEEGYITSHLDGNHGSYYPKSEEFVEEGVPYLSANCLANGRVDWSKVKYLTLERAAQLKKGLSQNNDVLFAHNATVGPIAILETQLQLVVLSTTLTYYRCNPEKVNNLYLGCYMQSPCFVNQYSRVMKQSTRNQVPITVQRSFLHIIPPIEEQKKIADIISSINGKIITEQRNLNQLQRLKNGLMQVLLTGKVRVKVDDQEAVTT